jgi:hypothetical protein
MPKRLASAECLPAESETCICTVQIACFLEGSAPMQHNTIFRVLW